MKTKEKVLEYLMNNGNGYVSGQQIADEIFVSRAAVWKAIKTLQKEGNQIEAVTNKGYRLIRKIHIPSAYHIKEYIQKRTAGSEGLRIPEILVVEETGSTNDDAKGIYEEDPEKEVIIIAGSQTKGKGRRGRKFYSPDKTGLYISFLLHPELPFSKAILMTCMMAEAVCRAIERVTGVEPGIKWVNDIFCHDRKVAGILAEGATSFEDGSLSYVVIGTGINLFMPYAGFPEELSKIAGSVLEVPFDNDLRDKLYGELIVSFFELYRNMEDESFIEDYKRRSVLIGNYVKIMQHGGSDKGNDYALVTGIDDECRLLVKHENGKEEALSSGEVSVVKY